MTESYLDFYRGRRVMITGGLGFIGSNIARRLVEEERFVPGGLGVEYDQARRLGVAVGAGDDDPVAVPQMRQRRKGAAEIGEAPEGQAGAAGS